MTLLSSEYSSWENPLGRKLVTVWLAEEHARHGRLSPSQCSVSPSLSILGLDLDLTGILDGFFDFIGKVVE
jgi:hypothetical protein